APLPRRHRGQRHPVRAPRRDRGRLAMGGCDPRWLACRRPRTPALPGRQLGTGRGGVADRTPRPRLARVMGWIEHDHADAAALVADVADVFDRACAEAVRERGHAWLALAGGRTPLPVYARLADSPHAAGIVAIPTDERCVPHDHPACNLRALCEAFGGSAVELLSLTDR